MNKKSFIQIFVSFSVFMLLVGVPLSSLANEDVFNVHNDTRKPVKVMWVSGLKSGKFDFKEETLQKGETKGHEFNALAADNRSIIIMPDGDEMQYSYAVKSEDSSRNMLVTVLKKDGYPYKTQVREKK